MGACRMYFEDSGSASVQDWKLRVFIIVVMSGCESWTIKKAER